MYICGKIKHVINRETEFLEPGQITVVHPDDQHWIRGIDAQKINLLNIKVKCSALQALLTPSDPNLYNDLLNSNRLVYTLSQSSKQEMETMINDLKTSTDRRSIVLALKSAVCEIVRLFLKDFVPNYFSNKNIIPKELYSVAEKLTNVQYIAASISDIRRGCGFSQTHLSRLFRKYYGCSLKEYHTAFRLEKALLFLKHSDTTILEISNTIGFYSLSHFDHIFKNRFGLSPLEFRRAHTTRGASSKGKQPIGE
jgi:AraC-like DNA-binding protein